MELNLNKIDEDIITYQQMLLSTTGEEQVRALHDAIAYARAIKEIRHEEDDLK